MNSKIKIALIGCGNWGSNIARNLFDLESLACVYDTNNQLMKTISNNFKVPILSLNEIFSDNGINAVVISSPANTHKELAQMALNSNKDVFIEKPFCLSLKEAQLISELTRKKNKILMVGHLLNYHNAFIKMKELISENKIGKIKNIRANRLALGRIRSSESVIYDLASHDISMVLSITKNLPKKLEILSVHHNSNVGPDAISLKLTFNNRTTALINCDWMCPYKEHKFSIVGTNGSLVFDDTKDWAHKLYFNPSIIKEDNSISYYPTEQIYVNKNEPLKKELKEFINSIQSRKSPLTDHNEAIKVQTVMEMIDKKLGKK